MNQRSLCIFNPRTYKLLIGFCLSIIIDDVVNCYWATIALQAKANDGEGPDILRNALDGGTSGHGESLAATLAEHQQHLSSFQVMK